MVTDTKLIEQLKRHEGKRNHAYQDHLGYWTIGYGRLIDERRGGGITDKEAEFLLTSDIIKCMRDLGSIPTYRQLDPTRQAALVNMCFQLGGAGIRAFANMWDALADHDYDRAADEALDSKWAKQTPGRADEIAEQIRTGEWQ